jgi:hypothetical protein
MQLPTELISEFQSLYKDEFGEDISKEAACEQGVNLVRLIQLIYKPISKEEFIRVQKEVEKIKARVNKGTNI